MNEDNKIEEKEDTNAQINPWFQLLGFMLTHSMFGDSNNTD